MKCILGVLMKQFLITVMVLGFSAVALAAPITVAVQMPAGLQVGKNMVTAQVQADAALNGAMVSVAVDPGNNQAVEEVVLGKIGDAEFKGEVMLKSINTSPSVTVKITQPDARYAATQVLAAGSTSAQFTLEEPRSQNRTPGLLVALVFIAFAGLGAMALRGQKTAF